jgi:hypothetical protein
MVTKMLCQNKELEQFAVQGFLTLNACCYEDRQGKFAFLPKNCIYDFRVIQLYFLKVFHSKLGFLVLGIIL